MEFQRRGLDEALERTRAIIRRRASEEKTAPLLAQAIERRANLIRDLVARRVEKGLSQDVVAARMGTSQPAVARLEAGLTDPKISTLERYAAAVEALIASTAIPARPEEDVEMVVLVALEDAMAEDADKPGPLVRPALALAG
jgi:transcriptional regulator with XRE-family HTH domain